MSKQILNALPELVAAGVISEDAAQNIRKYYQAQPSHSTNRLLVIFTILGSMLVGMGIVLIVAHNWDTLPKFAKLVIGFAPLLAGQVICGYLLVKRSTNKGWIEGAACFLMVAIAISISIVSQVYNIEGSLDGFLLIWMVLSLPVVYAMWSSMASMLFICGITWYASETAYFKYPHTDAILYWVLLLLIISFYYQALIKRGVRNNFFYFHSWLLVASVTICLGVVGNNAGELLFIGYMSLFSAFVIMGSLKMFQTGRVLSNAFLVVGSLGVMMLMMALSFDFFWDEIANHLTPDIISTREFIVSAVVSAIAAGLLILLFGEEKFGEINYKSFAFILMIALFFVGMYAPIVAQVGINLVILAFAVNTILSGAKQNHLGILNYGLLIITALIICRFFDTDMSFVMRGILFIGIGVGFFAANSYMLKKRKREQ